MNHLQESNMNVLAIRANFEPIREIAFGAIGAGYAAVGSALVNPIRIVRFTNMTDVDVYASLDGVHNHMRFAPGSFFLLDIETNREVPNKFALPVGTVFQVKAVSALPSSGEFYIETVYAS
jgi:hypothetical protein